MPQPILSHIFSCRKYAIVARILKVTVMVVVSIILPVKNQLTANRITVTIPLYKTVFARILLLFTNNVT